VGLPVNDRSKDEILAFRVWKATHAFAEVVNDGKIILANAVGMVRDRDGKLIGGNRKSSKGSSELKYIIHNIIPISTIPKRLFRYLVIFRLF
jgi:hypothetical protein